MDEALCCGCNGDVEKHDLMQPIFYLSQNGVLKGSERYEQCFTYWLNIPEAQMEKAFSFAEQFRLTALTCDDICDDSSLREGIPTSYLLFGMPKTIGAITFSLACIMQDLINLNKPEFFDLYHDTMMTILRGQGLEIYYRNHNICPTEEEYLNDVVPKTSAMFRFLFGFMQLLSDNKTDFTEVLTKCGNMFQLLNDYLDLRSINYNSLKGFCTDITEGTFTFPLIHAIRCHPEDDRVINILKERTKDIEKKKYCLSLLEEYGSLQYTRKKIEGILKELYGCVEQFPKNPAAEQMLQKCAKHLDPTAPMTGECDF